MSDKPTSVLIAFSSAVRTVALDFKEVNVRHTLLAFTIVLLTATVAACGGGSKSGSSTSALPQGSKPFKLDPGDFTTKIDNPYWSMKPGDHWVYRERNLEGDVERNDVVVTNETKTIMDIEAVVVHDTVKEGGQLKEDTFDWYAQDSRGNLWYLGENTAEYEKGKVKTREGSWEAGVGGALPGIIVPADPRIGQTYREEYYKGHAEDAAQVIGLNAYVSVPHGRYHHLFQTRNFSGIEPDVIEEKFYARGVGIVEEITISGGSDRSELVSFTHG